MSPIVKLPPPDGGSVLVTGSLRRTWRSDATAAGWTLIEDCAPTEPWNLAGVLVHTADPEVAALTVVRGGSVVFVGDLSSEPGRMLVDDVLRVGGSIWGDGGPDPDASGTTSDTDDLMAALVDGASVAAAARAACMSLRTAQRRLDTLRKQYGVSTTAGVVAVWARDHGRKDEERPGDRTGNGSPGVRSGAGRERLT